MVTAGCCCWYLAKATEKNGASNVEPAPVRVGPARRWGWPWPRCSCQARWCVVLLQAAEGEDDDRRGGGPMAGCPVWRGWGRALLLCPDMAAPLLEDPERVSAAGLARIQAWAPIWTASQGLPSGGV